MGGRRVPRPQDRRANAASSPHTESADAFRASHWLRAGLG